MYRALRFIACIACFLTGVILMLSGPFPFVREVLAAHEWYLVATITGMIGTVSIITMAVSNHIKGGRSFGLALGGWMLFISLLLFAQGEFFAWLARGLSGGLLVTMGLILFQGPEVLRKAAARPS